LVEHLLCKQGVVGSTPSASTPVLVASSGVCRGDGDYHGKAGLGWISCVTREGEGIGYAA